MQMNRLFEIVYLLLERKTITAAELAQRFEVSTRTIYRDIDTLSSAGIPVYASKGKGGGIGLLPDFVLNKSLLSEDEQKEILFGLQSLKATNALQTSRILAKLSTLFHKEEVHWIDVDFSGWNSGEAERSKFGQLKTAILEQRVVKFVYYSSYGQRTERQVEPMKLQFKNRSWYLQCFCLKSRELRIFKISRIEELEVTETRFNRRKLEIVPLDAQMPDERLNYVELALLFPPHMAYRVFDEFEWPRIHKREDGDYLVTASYPEDDWVYGYLLSFGENVTVLSPPHIRNILRNKAKKIAELYPS
ncbi:YafY family protein [Paenibacillus barengoltzii]|uniref:helix-turn-helix transcriptional regulator n=1 Tax=Paenibacillus barengoltzii TaxID=343517 RepID=UPI002DBBC4D5|nr:YafY family protein [Paenibacillus barengoltzii]MEC2345587.1 YafY family protein [Paenibacillus barengoltzii]